MAERTRYNGIFLTERLPLASFLHANGKLGYVGCEYRGPRRAAFIFADPMGTGANLELEFDNGAVASATALLASQKFLRQELDKALGQLEERRIGKHEYTQL